MTSCEYMKWYACR